MLSPWPTSITVISSCPARTDGAKGCHSIRPRQRITSRDHAMRHLSRRASATASREPDIATASHKGGVAIRHAGSIPACQFTTICEIQSNPPASFATQTHPVKTATKPAGTTSAHQRHHHGVGREAGEADTVEVNHHRQRQSDLHDRRDRGDLVDKKADARRRSRPARPPAPAASGGGPGWPKAGAFRCGTVRRAAPGGGRVRYRAGRSVRG